MPACISSVSRTRTCARTSCASRSAAVASPTTRWTGTARPVASMSQIAAWRRAQHGSGPAVSGLRSRHWSASSCSIERGVDVAILHPMTRGIMPDRHLGTAIASAHNEMMVTRWLEHAGVRRQVPRHHPGQPRRHRRRVARDRQVQGPPARRADRRPAAVPRALREAAVLAVVGSGGRREPGGRGAYRGGRGYRRCRPRRPARPAPTSSTCPSCR